MATHIVRIYRTGKGPPPWASGLVEAVQGAARYPFRNAEELWAILLELEGEARRPAQDIAVEVEREGRSGEV